MNSMFKFLMGAVCAAVLPAFGQGEKTDFPTDKAVTVFSAGEGNPYASIRIPALLNIGKGQLLAFAEGRYKNTDQGENDIIMSVSKNGGKTWSRPRADIINILKDELGIKRAQAETAVKLIDEGNTIPFIARYRKEMTGSLDDETLRNLDERLKYLRNLQDRKDAVLKSIEEQGKLSEELKKQIEEAVTLVTVEDLYRPYKQKKRTRAMIDP